jgi:hypothetical protein
VRLDQPFHRLPLRVDAARLHAEVRAFRDHEWRPDRFRVAGYSSLNLVSYRGGDNDAQASPMRATAYLARAPYLRQVLAALEAPLAEVRLRWLDGAEHVPPHHDSHHYFFDRLRVHVPITTDPSVRFVCDGEAVHMAAGEVWAFDRQRLHSVENAARASRIHLIADTVGSAALRSMLRGGGERSIEYRPGWDPTLDTDLCAREAVLPAADVHRFVDDLIARTPRGTFADALERFAWDWRALWVRWGAAREAWPRYVALVRALHDELAPIGDAGDGARPSAWQRLRAFLETGPFNPHHAAQPITLDGADASRLGLVGELLVAVEPGGALAMRPASTDEWRAIELDELALLCAFGDGATAIEAARAARLEPDADLFGLIGSWIDEDVLGPRHPPLVLGAPPAAADARATPEPVASPARTADHARVPRTLYLRVFRDGRLGLWRAGARQYEPCSLAALRFLRQLAADDRAEIARAAGRAGVADDRSLRALVASMLELGVVTAC